MEPTKNILIVDDDDVSNYLHSMIIKDSGFEGNVETFTSGSNALDYIDQHNEKIGLIFLDLNMPGINGFEFLDKLHEMDQTSIPVVVLTSLVYNANIQIPDKYNSCITEVIEKPLSEKSVREVLATIS